LSPHESHEHHEYSTSQHAANCDTDMSLSSSTPTDLVMVLRSMSWFQ